MDKEECDGKRMSVVLNSLDAITSDDTKYFSFIRLHQTNQTDRFSAYAARHKHL